MSNIILVFDVGTTGARSILFNDKGAILEKEYIEYPKTITRLGISEQDPLVWWNSIKDSCKSVVKRIDDISKIEAICVTTHRASTSFVDKDFNVLYPSIGWDDLRISKTQQDLLEKHKSADFVYGAFQRWAIQKVLWFKENYPDKFAKVHKIIQPDSYFYYKLGEVFVTEPTNAAWGVLDFKTFKLSEKLSQEIDVPIDYWIEVDTPGNVVGELTNNAASELGLKKGIPLILGGGDQQMSVLGAGVHNNGQCKITLGTGMFVDVISNVRKIDQAGFIFCHPHLFSDKWVLEGPMPGTGTLLNWYRDNFAGTELKEAEETKKTIYEVFDKKVKLVSPGSDGLFILPSHFEAKGRVYGWSFYHTSGHFIRAIYEATATAAQMWLSMIQALLGTKINDIRLVGGGSNSQVLSQIISDALQKDIHLMEVNEATALGAAILGFIGLNYYKSPEEAISKMVQIKSTLNPNKENKKSYKKLGKLFLDQILNVVGKKRITGKIKI
ncbi:MAG: FGGY-family carbohydrate kinase [Candidatus Helarchaeota archaeon]